MELLWLIPFLPFAGFMLLSFFNNRLTVRQASLIGCGSIGISFLTTLWIASRWADSQSAETVFVQKLWRWIDVMGFQPDMALHLDPLSLLMMAVVTGVGFLIHIYSMEYMAGDPAYIRFFAYMNLFVGFMLMLVMADNLMLLYLGWEGVGLCSYLLIGFWYQDPENGYAARKAFVVTRIGDTALAVGLFILFQKTGTLHIQTILSQVSDGSVMDRSTVALIALLLLGGAVGKSAQLPLQTWLPDAMAGPTPVSALIHAATMVTAGVYLIARMHSVFDLSPDVQFLVTIIALATLLLSGFSALTQTDIKRVLAYSTISQIGYMFLGLGVGAYDAAMMHFMTHAFFKALLFLAAGAVILSLHHEQNIFRMGGLYRRMPGVFWVFLAGGGALAGLPLITSGFFSKDLILYRVWLHPQHGRILWMAGLLGALLTSIYTFRLIFLVFFGEPKSDIQHSPGRTIMIPLSILAFLSIASGWIELPSTLGGFHGFSRYISPVFPALHEGHGEVSEEMMLQVIAGTASILGILISYWIYLRRPRRVRAVESITGELTWSSFLRSGWGFDWIYDRLLIFPFQWLAAINRRDVVDDFFNGTASLLSWCHLHLIGTQTGQLRWYAAWIAAGTVISISVAVFLW